MKIVQDDVEGDTEEEQQTESKKKMKRGMVEEVKGSDWGTEGVPSVKRET